MRLPEPAGGGSTLPEAFVEAGKRERREEMVGGCKEKTGSDGRLTVTRLNFVVFPFNFKDSREAAVSTVYACPPALRALRGCDTVL